MPQMSPSWWFTLFMMFGLMVIMLIIKINYYMFEYEIDKKYIKMISFMKPN